jgi:hypothetical protein
MTTAIATAGIEFWLLKQITTPKTLTPTGVTSAKPAVITVADTTGVVVGDLITMSGTDDPMLDGKDFIASVVTPTDITLLGSDTSGAVIALGVAPVLTYNEASLAGTSDMVKLCLATFSRAAGTADTVSVGTTCDPSASIAGPADAGTISFDGFMDPTEQGYLELMLALESGADQLLMVKLPKNKGSIIYHGTINSYSEDFPLSGAISFSSGMALKTNPTYVWP